LYISAIINVYDWNTKSLNHILAMSFITICMYIIPRHTLRNEVKNELKVNYLHIFSKIAFYTLAGCVSLDFIAINLYKINISDFLTISNVKNGNHYHILGNIRSAAGPTEEPAVAAYYLALLYMTSGALAKTARTRTTHVQVAALSISIALTFSSVGYLLLAGILFIEFRKFSFTKYAIGLITLLYATFNYETIYNLLEGISFFDKITLSIENRSASLRMHSWRLFYNAYLAEPYFGIAPGFNNILVLTGVHSTFFTILINYGIITLLPFVLFLISIFTNTKDSNLKLYFIISLLPHLIADYYFSLVFWIFIAVIASINEHHKQES
jgi:hypothetical protein